MCVSNRIEQFSASYFRAGLSPILLAQVAHEQDVYDDRPGDGNGRPDGHAPHIGHATDVVRECRNDDADVNRHRYETANNTSFACHLHFSHLLSKGELKAKGDSSPF